MKNLWNKLGWAKWIVVLSVFVASAFSLQAYASTSSGVIISSVSALLNLLCTAFDWMFYFLMVISTIMILVAAFIYVTASGDSEKINKATKTIVYAAIGVAVALLAKGFPAIIGSFFGQGYSACGSTPSVTSTFTPGAEATP